MSRPPFLRIQFALKAHDPYFILKRNAAETLGLSSLQKVTAAMRMLAYSVAANVVDESQESARKDVERAFRVLQARFAIVREPSRFWDLPTLRDITKACIIMFSCISASSNFFAFVCLFSLIASKYAASVFFLASIIYFKRSTTIGVSMMFFSGSRIFRFSAFLPGSLCTKSVFRASSSIRFMRLSGVEGDDMSEKDFVVLPLNDDLCLLMSSINFGWSLNRFQQWST
ncbi:hypothetical protein HHK36_008957 [Tetracentron sinense]|uniref:Uncharacterized protein n=1 Tax=Tetracentron sinense TaxID=13715 RepID=A0A834ZEG9_TETSI|nr:hypothetical protein HHK36_008957 [Tetracentron sinense]